MAFMKGGNNMIKTLGQMVGLLLGLYVFDQIITVVLPLAANCTGGTTNYNASQATLCNSGTASMFTTALVFTKNLFPVVGIMGTFEIIYRGLRKSGLM